MKIYVTANAPAIAGLIQEMVESGRAGSNSEAVTLLLNELLDLRERHERLLQGILNRITVAGVEGVTPLAPAPPQPPDADDERLTW